MLLLDAHVTPRDREAQDVARGAAGPIGDRAGEAPHLGGELRHRSDEVGDRRELSAELAVLCELDPVYADVICQRWEEHTGIVPVRGGEQVSFAGR